MIRSLCIILLLSVWCAMPVHAECYEPETGWDVSTLNDLAAQGRIRCLVNMEGRLHIGWFEVKRNVAFSKAYYVLSMQVGGTPGYAKSADCYVYAHVDSHLDRVHYAFESHPDHTPEQAYELRVYNLNVSAQRRKEFGYFHHADQTFAIQFGADGTLERMRVFQRRIVGFDNQNEYNFDVQFAALDSNYPNVEWLEDGPVFTDRT